MSGFSLSVNPLQLVKITGMILAAGYAAEKTFAADQTAGKGPLAETLDVVETLLSAAISGVASLGITASTAAPTVVTTTVTPSAAPPN